MLASQIKYDVRHFGWIGRVDAKKLSLPIDPANRKELAGNVNEPISMRGPTVTRTREILAF